MKLLTGENKNSKTINIVFFSKFYRSRIGKNRESE